MPRLQTAHFPRFTRFALATLLSVVAGGAAVIAASPSCDVDFPRMTSLTLDPTSVDITSSDQTVNCSMNVLDADTGVEEATCKLGRGAPWVTRSCTSTAPATGDRQNGTFSCAITLPQFSPTGSWFTQFDLRDRAGNAEFTQTAAARLAVTGIVSDTKVPNLTALTLSPSTVNTSSADRTIQCTMTATDNLSGVEWMRCAVWSPPGSSVTYQIEHRCETTTRISGTPMNGVYQCNITVPRSSPAGQWEVRVDLADRAGVNQFLGAPELAARGLPSQVTVSSSPQDVTPPTLVEIDLVPDFGDSLNADVVVPCRAHLTDALSGVGKMQCVMSNSPASGFRRKSCETTAPLSGTPLDGWFGCDVTLARGSAGGIWSAAIDVTDRAGNLLRAQSSSLDPALDDSEYYNGCGLPEEPQVRFRDGSTTSLFWNRLDGAVRFDVYRGVAAGLSDFDQDGRADDYGLCQNPRDPNLQDNRFDDTDIPTLSTRAFTYLVGWHTQSENRGVGATTAGLPRTIITPCP